MKIAVLGTRGVPAEYGGFETFAEFLSVGLANEGHEVEAYCPHYQTYREPTYKGVKLIRVWHPERFFVNRNFRALCTIVFDFLSLLKAAMHGADIIYMCGYASGPCLVVPRLFGKTLVVNPDGLEWNSARWGRLARGWLYVCEYLASVIPQGLVADAEPIAERFKRKYGADAMFIPYGTEVFDRSQAVPIEWERDSFYIAIARMVPETEIPAIIRGVKMSGSRKRLLVVGPTPDKRFFETEVLPLVDNEQVFYLGAIYDRPRLKTMRMDAAALLHGHASEGTNPSLLESMGCGAPIIAIDRASNIDAVTPENGLYWRNDEELAARIRVFEAMSEDQRRTLGRRNYERAVAEYSWARSVARHLRFFESLLRREPAAS